MAWTHEFARRGNSLSILRVIFVVSQGDREAVMLRTATRSTLLFIMLAIASCTATSHQQFISSGSNSANDGGGGGGGGGGMGGGM